MVKMNVGERSYNGLMLNLSQGGAFVGCDLVLQKGQQLRLSFALPNGTTISAIAEIRWNRLLTHAGEFPGVGVQFLDLQTEHLEELRRFLLQQSFRLYN